MGSTTENSYFRSPKTPGDLDPGAGRLLRRRVRPAWPPGRRPTALGSDTGGSIRQPAAFCGVVGHEAHLRRGFPLRAGGVRLLPGPDRPPGQNCGGRRRWSSTPSRDRTAGTPPPLHRSLRATSPPPWTGDVKGLQDRPAASSISARASARRSSGAVLAAAKQLRALGAEIVETLPAQSATRPARLLRHLLRRGLLQPGPVRRGQIRLPG